MHPFLQFGGNDSRARQVHGVAVGGRRRIWISTCRGCSRVALEAAPRRRRRRPAPRAARASTAPSRSPRSRSPRRMPRPPPPAAALTSSGKPSATGRRRERAPTGRRRRNRVPPALRATGHRRASGQRRRRASPAAGRSKVSRRRRSTGSANVGVLGQEAVARVDRVGAQRGGSRPRTSVGASRNDGGPRPPRRPRRTCSAPASSRQRTAPPTAMPELAAGADHAHRDLAAVGDREVG